MISVQQLRGIAVLLVVLFHMTTKLRDNGFWQYGFSIGMSGVDIFFVISGFIMMLISKRESNFFIKEGRQNISSLFNCRNYFYFNVLFFSEYI
ncbi:acyltransferase family protein [Klebsiella aerogenes]